MEKSFEYRVKKTKLTKTAKKIAEHFLQNKSTVIFQPLSEISNILEISDVSIVRFARTIGYDGFIDLKHALQREVVSNIDEIPESINTVEKYIVNRELNRTKSKISAFNAFESYANILEDTLKKNNMEVFYQAAQRLIDSDKKYIVGWRSRVGSVHNMSVLLELLLPNIIPVTEESWRSFLRFIHLSKNDSIVLFSFGRLPEIEIDLIEAIRKSGSYLIVISDQRVSAPSLAANLFIYSKSNTKHMFYSSISNAMIAEIIASNIIELKWEKIKDKVALSEKFINKQMAKG